MILQSYGANYLFMLIQPLEDAQPELWRRVSHRISPWQGGPFPKTWKLIVFAHFVAGDPSYASDGSTPGLGWTLSGLGGAYWDLKRASSPVSYAGPEKRAKCLFLLNVRNKTMQYLVPLIRNRPSDKKGVKFQLPLAAQLYSRAVLLFQSFFF